MTALGPNRAKERLIQACVNHEPGLTDTSIRPQGLQDALDVLRDREVDFAIPQPFTAIGATFGKAADGTSFADLVRYIDSRWPAWNGQRGDSPPTPQPED